MEARRKVGLACRPRDCDAPGFEGLAQGFERRPGELGQLVEKEHAVMGEADFTGIWKCAAAKQTDIADGVMG